MSQTITHPHINSSPHTLTLSQRGSDVNRLSEAVIADRRAQNSSKWLFVNITLMIVFYMGCLQLAFSSTHFIFKYADLFLCVMFSWNVVTNLYLYCSTHYTLQNLIPLTSDQKKLFGINKQQEKFCTVKETQPLQTTPQTNRIPYPIRRQTPPSRVNRSPHQDSSPTGHHSAFTPPRYSPGQQYSPSRTNTSFSMHRTTPSPNKTSPGLYSGSPNTLRKSPSLRGCISPSRISPSRNSEEMLDYSLVEKFVEKDERNEDIARRTEPDRSKQWSVWSFKRSAFDHIPNFGSYQLATKSQTPTSKDEDVITDSPDKFDQAWNSLGLTAREINFWTENLRKWIAQSVLEPLVKEIELMNARLTQLGNPELHIGNISEQTLHSLAQQKSQQLPSLASIVPYIELTANQEYLVARLKELSKGGCLRLYRAASGGTFKNKAWNPDLLTDAQIMLHVFCTYMDTHLPANPRHTNGKSFSGSYFIKTPTKPSEKKNKICIYQSRITPPHFKVLWNDDIIDLPKGRNNLFHAILIFLHLIKRENHSMLERVNLGMSGINILWVLEKR